MTRTVDKVNQVDDEMLLALIERAVDVTRAELASATGDGEAGLAMMEMRALAFVARNEGATAGDLVRRSGRDKAQIARIIAHLMERGLVVRESRSDRRSHALHLTTEGRTVHRRLQRRRSRAVAKLFARLSTGERGQLAALLRRLTSVIAGNVEGHPRGSVLHLERRRPKPTGSHR